MRRHPFPHRVDTARLLLAAPTAADLPELQALVGDPRVPEWQFPARFRTPDAVAAALDRALATWRDRGFGPWLARARTDGALVARVGLQPGVHAGRDVVEAAWFVAVDAQGRGYATEAARTAVACGFRHLGLAEVHAWTLPANAPSLAVMRRLGFRELGPFEHVGLPHVAYVLAAPEAAG